MLFKIKQTLFVYTVIKNFDVVTVPILCSIFKRMVIKNKLILGALQYQLH